MRQTVSFQEILTDNEYPKAHEDPCKYMDSDAFENFQTNHAPDFIDSLLGSGEFPQEEINRVDNMIAQTVECDHFGTELRNGIYTDYWVELGLGQPGDLEKSPCTIWCSHVREPGSVTRRDYQYI